MENLAVSFASLVKSNNGMFKSEKQASFLLSRTCDGVFYASGSSYGNHYSMAYFCDAKGVYKVTKETRAKGTVAVWERKSEAEYAALEAAKAATKAAAAARFEEEGKAYARRERIAKLMEKADRLAFRACRKGNEARAAHFDNKRSRLERAL